MKKGSNLLKILILLLLALDLVVWYLVLFPFSLSGPEFYFLKVGQGDSSLALLPGNGGNYAKFLIDGGPLNGRLSLNLDKIPKANGGYLDLIFVSHPEIDHFGGLMEIIKNRKVGAVLYNGEEGNGGNWKEFNAIVSGRNIPKIPLDAGDKIFYADSELKVINSSGGGFGNSNDSGLVLAMESGGIKVLFAADISAEVEETLINMPDIKADILKVAHHGSKYSSGLDFLKKVNPSISVIESGKNSYGHPAKETLERLSEVGSKIFNTDKDGIIKIINESGSLKVFNISL